MAPSEGRVDVRGHGRAEAGALRGLSILIAEDDVDSQRLMRWMLERGGARVTVADDGQGAVEAQAAARASGTDFDAVLLDVQMPGLDGMGAARALRQAGVLAPIVALTARATPDDREACLAAGCTWYLSKPIDRDTLVLGLADLVSAAARRAA